MSTTAIPPRTCSTCSAYEDGECGNLVSFRRGDGPYEAPKPGDVCDDHTTVAEDREDTRIRNAFRRSVGLPPINPAIWPEA